MVGLHGPNVAVYGFGLCSLKGRDLSPEIVNLGCFKAQKAAFKLDSGLTDVDRQ